MKRKVKMFLYGDPGVGKSTFASKAPNPLFLCTDANFEWLGLPNKNHIQLESYAQFKNIVADICAGKYNEFDTIVLDLVEDLYTWATKEFCTSKKIEHIGDYKSFGAGYDLIRKDVFTEISKLINYDANFIGLSHGVLKIEKDRKGTEHHKYYPHDSISVDKLWTPLEGRVRYFLRCYMKPEEVDGKVKKVRYLSVNPKENEFGIARGLDESNVPDDIKLDWDLFVKTIGVEPEELVRDNHEVTKNVKPVTAKKTDLPEILKSKPTAEEVKPIIKESKPIIDKPVTTEIKPVVEEVKLGGEEIKQETIVEEPQETKPVVEEVKQETIINGPVTDDQILDWLKQGLTVTQVESTYGIKLSQAEKIKFIQLKVKALSK